MDTPIFILILCGHTYKMQCYVLTDIYYKDEVVEEKSEWMNYKLKYLFQL